MSADLICAGTLSVGATMGHQEGIWGSYSRACPFSQSP